MRASGAEPACIGSWLAQLHEAKTCRVSYPARSSPEPDSTLCLNALEWDHLLERGALPQGCGEWSGRWRWGNSPLLEGDRASLLVEHGPDPPERNFSPLAMLRLFLERLRVQMSTDLAPCDPLGVARILLLNELAGESAPGMLRRLGFVHILAASGIHLYSLSVLVSLGVRSLLGRIGLQAGFALSFARVTSLSLWLFCWGLAGGRPGMLRPLLLVGFRNGADVMGVKLRPWAPLFVALAIDLSSGLLHGSVSARGLGYGLAVAGGLAGIRALGARARKHAPSARAKEAIALALGSWLFLALLEAWQDFTIALATPVLSLVTLPCVSFLCYPLLILASLVRLLGSWVPSLWSATLSLGLSHFASQALTLGVAGLARAAMGMQTLWVVPRAALLLGGALSAAALVAPRSACRSVSRVAVLSVLLVALFLRPWLSREMPGLRQLSVGQGDAALVVGERGSGGLIDAGSEHTTSDSRWIGLLASSGLTHLDWVALTHLDEDHAGGVHSLLALLPIGCVETAQAQWDMPRGERLEHLLAKAGTTPTVWGSGCVPYPTLAPAQQSGVSEANSAMGAVWVPLTGGGSYLSAGDATASDEPRIGRWARVLSERWEQGHSRWRILKVSHHGSKTSSAPEFLDEFGPDEFWISVGRGNLYGHPDPGVLERLKETGRPVHRTDGEGELRAGAGHHPQ